MRLKPAAGLPLDKNGDPDVAAGDARVTAKFERVRSADSASPRTWSFRLVRSDPLDQRGYEEKLEIRLPYRRTFALWGPEFELKWVSLHAGNSVFALLDEVFTKHGLQYQYDWPQKEP